MASLAIASAPVFTGASLVAGGLLASVIMQRFVGTQYRELPDASIGTQVLGAVVAVASVSVSLTVFGRVWSTLL